MLPSGKVPYKVQRWILRIRAPHCLLRWYLIFGKATISIFLFSNDRRTELKSTDSDITFAELVTQLGTNWTGLRADKKKVDQDRASEAKREYMVAMEEYEKTTDFAEFQTQMAEWELSVASRDVGTPEKTPDSEWDVQSKPSPECRSAVKPHLTITRSYEYLQQNCPGPYESSLNVSNEVHFDKKYGNTIIWSAHSADFITLWSVKQ